MYILVLYSMLTGNKSRTSQVANTTKEKHNAKLEVKSAFACADFPDIALLRFVYIYKSCVENSLWFKSINAEKVHILFLYKTVIARKCIKGVNLHLRRYVDMTTYLFFYMQEPCNHRK